MAIQQQYINADYFWELSQHPQYDDSLVELVEGEIVQMPKPGGLHGIVAMRIGSVLHTFVEKHNLGYVTAAETGYVLKRNAEGRDTVRGLDCGYIHKGRLPDGIPEKHIPVAPDLAVEVISPGNSAEDINEKILELLSAGTQLIWIVFTTSKTVDVHTKDKAIRKWYEDTLDGGDVLPDFRLPVKDIFPPNLKDI